MFRKSNGTAVWLRTAQFMPYFKAEGTLELPSDMSMSNVLCQLKGRYKQVFGICHASCFQVKNFGDDGGVLFCAGSDRRCALLLFGQKHVRIGTRGERTDRGSERLLGLNELVDEVANAGGFAFRIGTIGCEISAID